jgi:hypothetical protein
MTASNPIFLVIDAGTPVAAFTARPELKAFLQRRREAFTNPLARSTKPSASPRISTRRFPLS